MKKRHLLFIDPQNDFCLPAPPSPDAYIPGTHGSLSVPGALEDMQRVAKLLANNIQAFDSITVTMDSHEPIHIAHPDFIHDANGNHPAPFTLIEHADVVSGKFRGALPQWTSILRDYTKELEDKGQYKLCIWAPHCLIGTPGWCIEAELLSAITTWSRERKRNPIHVTKGSNPYTEHYGACQAEVPRDDDPSTKLNKGLIDLMLNVGDNDDIVVAGEALSHCLRTTMYQITENFTDEQVKRFVLLTDACSNVPGFEAQGDEFIKEMTKRGMRTATTTDYL